MPAGLTLLEVVDYALLAAGAGYALLLACRWAAPERRRRALRLRPPRMHRLSALDVLVAFMATLTLPSFASMMIRPLRGGEPPPPAPADGLPDLDQALALAIGETLAIGVLLLIGRERFAGGLAGWGLGLRRWRSRLAQAVGAYLFFVPICFVCLEGTTALLRIVAPGYEPPQHASIRLLLAPETDPLLAALTIFNALVLAGIVEELFFRGILLPALHRWLGGTWPAVILSAGLFGMTHYPYADTIPALAVFGLVLGYLYARTRSLVMVVMVHAVFNGKTLLWLLLGAEP
jgi:membrane protease YdiL (CAAX protease family)